MTKQTHFQYAEWHTCTTSADIVVPEVCRLLEPKSVLDVGCGTGNWLHTFARHGVEDYYGLDLSEHRSEFFIDAAHFRQANLDEPFDLQRRFDLVMSLEVAEHLLPTSGPAFVDSLLRHGDLILFSAAIPEQKGTKHINTHWQQYWVDLFAERGLQPDFTLRNTLWDDERLRWWYRQNILVFSRQPLSMPPSTPPTNVVHPDHYLSVVARLEKTQRELNRFASPRNCGKALVSSVKGRVAERMKKQR